MRSAPLLLLLALGATSLLPGCTRGRGGGGGDDVPSGPLVRELSIEGLALYQGVRVDLVAGGQEVFSSSPVDVIAGREALLRVFVTPGADWENRQVGASLELDVGGETEHLSVEEGVNGGSSDDSLGSTINFDIPAELMTPETAIVSVTLREVDDEAPDAGDSSGATWTADGGGLALDAISTGSGVRVVLVPIEYRGDGSGRLPDLSDEQVAIYRGALYGQYPAQEVDLVIADPLVINFQISPFGNGWGETLDLVSNRRDSDGAAFDEYYYGLLMPAANFGEFCQGGCIAGLSSLAFNPGDTWARNSIGLGYPGEGSAGTMVHEIGHAHGREHAPCGVNNPGAYPHPGGSIGVQGYDLVGGQLKGASQYTDFMGYCDPTWVSDYTFNWLADRITAVNAQAEIQPAPGFDPVWSSLRIDLDGAAYRGGERTLVLPPQGAAQPIELLGPSGELLGTTQGSFHPYDHLAGGTLLFPRPPAGTAMVRLADGQTLPW